MTVHRRGEGRLPRASLAVGPFLIVLLLAVVVYLIVLGLVSS
jgi:hypothetical protein